MTFRRPLVLVAAVLALVVAGTACDRDGDDGDSLVLRSLGSGDDSDIDTGVERLRVELAADDDAYQALWAEHEGGGSADGSAPAPAPAPPPVDFSVNVVVAAFRTGGPAERVEVSGVAVDDGGTLVATIRLGVPDGDCTFPASIENHFAFVAVRRPAGLGAGEPKLRHRVDEHTVGCA